MAATEEETFRLLKRTPFKDLLEAMKGVTTKRKGDLILKKHNWTPDEFLAKGIELNEALFQQYIKDNPQPKDKAMSTAFDPSKYQLDQIPQIIEELQAHMLSKRAETLTAAATAYMTAVHNHKISLLEAVQALDTVEKLAAAGITFSSGKSPEKNGPISAKPRRARLPFPKEYVIKNPEPKGRELKEYTVGKVPVPQWVYRGIEAGTIKP